MNIYRTHILQTSGKIAKTRAKMAVAGDRLGCNPDELLQMQKEIVNILSKYMDIDDQVFGIRLNIIYEINRGIQDVKTIQIK